MSGSSKKGQKRMRRDAESAELGKRRAVTSTASSSSNNNYNCSAGKTNVQQKRRRSTTPLMTTRSRTATSHGSVAALGSGLRISARLKRKHSSKPKAQHEESEQTLKSLKSTPRPATKMNKKKSTKTMSTSKSSDKITIKRKRKVRLAKPVAEKRNNIIGKAKVIARQTRTVGGGKQLKKKVNSKNVLSSRKRKASATIHNGQETTPTISAHATSTSSGQNKTKPPRKEKKRCKFGGDGGCRKFAQTKGLCRAHGGVKQITEATLTQQKKNKNKKSKNATGNTRKGKGKAKGNKLDGHTDTTKSSVVVATEWQKCERLIKRLVARVLFNKGLLNAYEGSGWGDAHNHKNRVTPTQELKRARELIVKDKRAMRDTLKELMTGHNSQQEIKMQLKRGARTIDEDTIVCAVCLSGDSSLESNDILLCDLKGCNRAFHQQCLHPIVPNEELTRLVVAPASSSSSSSLHAANSKRPSSKVETASSRVGGTRAGNSSGSTRNSKVTEVSARSGSRAKVQIEAHVHTHGTRRRGKRVAAATTTTNDSDAMEDDAVDADLAAAAPDGDDDDWFCHRCKCSLRCLNVLNETFDSDFNCWEEVFPETETSQINMKRGEGQQQQQVGKRRGSQKLSRRAKPTGSIVDVISDDMSESWGSDSDPDDWAVEEEDGHQSDLTDADSGDEATDSDDGGGSWVEVNDVNDGGSSYEVSEADDDGGSRYEISESDDGDQVSEVDDGGLRDEVSPNDESVGVVLTGKRKRTRVDYVALAQQMGDTLMDDDENDLDVNEDDHTEKKKKKNNNNNNNNNSESTATSLSQQIKKRGRPARSKKKRVTSNSNATPASGQEEEKEKRNEKNNNNQTSVTSIQKEKIGDPIRSKTENNNMITETTPLTQKRKVGRPSKTEKIQVAIGNNNIKEKRKRGRPVSSSRTVVNSNNNNNNGDSTTPTPIEQRKKTGKPFGSRTRVNNNNYDRSNDDDDDESPSTTRTPLKQKKNAGRPFNNNNNNDLTQKKKRERPLSNKTKVNNSNKTNNNNNNDDNNNNNNNNNNNDDNESSNIRRSGRVTKKTSKVLSNFYLRVEAVKSPAAAPRQRRSATKSSLQTPLSKQLSNGH